MKQYRTKEQFFDIVDSAINGNWSEAGKSAVEYGFYANDFANKCEEYVEEVSFFDQADFALIVEIAEKIRTRQAVRSAEIKAISEGFVDGYLQVFVDEHIDADQLVEGLRYWDIDVKDRILNNSNYDWLTEDQISEIEEVLSYV
jgi:hypothetical protein